MNAEERVHKLRESGVNIRMSSAKWPDHDLENDDRPIGKILRVRVITNGKKFARAVVVLDSAIKQAYFDIVEAEWHCLLNEVLRSAGIDG